MAKSTEEFLLFVSRFVQARTIQKINRWLFVAAAVLGVVFILDLLLVSPKRKWQKELVSYSENHPFLRTGASLGTSGSAPAFESYSAAIAGKDIFSQAAFQEESREKISTTGDLVLVGILTGPNPKAILEDKTAKMTYYLTKNQSVNGMTVLEIEEKKVVVDSNGEKITFTL